VNEFDAIVLGGGPAGSAAALTLRARGHTVALVEATRYEAERVGETLAPPVLGMLEQLGIGAVGGVASFSTRASWGDRVLGVNPFVLMTSGHGRQVDRRAFDAQLADAAEAAGALVLRGARPTYVERGWRVWIGGRELRARVVVDGTGRGARFARTQGARKVVEDRLVGVSGVFEGMTGEPGVLVEACRDGWWYSARLPGERVLACFLSDRDLVAKGAWREGLRRQPHTSARVAGAAWPERLHVHSARTQRLDAAAGDGWLAAGDAAATVDPLSSQGILKALRGGVFAAYAISDHLAGDRRAFARYARFVAAEHDDERAARAAVYARERRWAAAPFWRRRHALVTSER
jgi:flavin-dependent dehydrogenase